MTDFARLQIVVDSRQIKTAERELRNFTRASRDTTSQTQRMDRATRNATTAKQGMAKAGTQLTRVLGALGVALSVGAMVRFTRNALSAADELGKLSRQVGIGTDALQAWDFAASQSGVSSSALQNSIERLTRRVGEARQGTGELAKLTKQLGIDTSNTEAAFRSVADAIQNASDENEAATIAMQAFGRGGLQMVRMLRDGSAGLADFERRARDMGMILDSELIRKSEMFNDRMDQLGRQIRTSFQSGLLDGFLRDMNETSDAIMDPQLKESLRTIGELVGSLGSLAANAAGDLANLTAAIINLLNAGGALTTSEIEAAEALRLRRLEQRYQMLGERIQSNNQTIEAYNKLLRENAVPGVEEDIRRWIQALETSNLEIEKERESLGELIGSLKVVGEETNNTAQANLDYKDSIEEVNEAVEDYSDELQRLMDRLDPSAAKSRQYTKEVNLLYRAFMDGKKGPEEYLKALKLLSDEQRTITKETPEVVRAAEDVGRAWSAAMEDVDRAFVRLFESAFRGFQDFAETLKTAFIRLIATLAYEAAKRRIIIGLGMGGLGGAPGAAGAAGTAMQGAGALGQMGATFGGIAAGAQAGFGMAMQNIGAAGYFGAAGANLSMAASSASVGAWGTAIGAAAPYVVPAVVAAVMLSSAFSRKHTESGMFGSFEGGSVEAHQYDFWKGGAFRSNKMRLGDSDPAFARELANLREGTARMAETMGLGGDAIREFTGEARINLKGLSEDQAAAKIREEFLKLQQRMAEVVPDIENFTYAGLQAGEAFRQLAEDTNALMDRLGVTQDAIANILLQGLTGRLEAAQIGEQLADVVIGGVYNAIASEYAQEIASVFKSQILTPIFAAITAGVPISQAISQGAINAVVATAQQAAANIAAIFNDPGFRAAIGAIEGAIRGISGAVAIRVPRFAPAPPPRVAPMVAQRDKVAEERKRLEMELLRLQENEVEIRRRERAELNASNRALYDRIKALEDEKAALRELTAASRGVVDEIKRLRGEQISDSAAGLMAQFAVLTAQARSGDLEALQRLPEFSRLLSQSALMTAGTAADVARMRAWLTRSLEDTLGTLGLDIPEFANGGYHRGGMRIVGERGPELEVTGPSRILSHRDLMSAIGNGGSAESMEAIRSEIRGLRSELARTQHKIERNTRRTSDTLTIWDADGLPAERT
jgi:hypothetical protein